MYQSGCLQFVYFSLDIIQKNLIRKLIKFYFCFRWCPQRCLLRGVVERRGPSWIRSFTTVRLLSPRNNLPSRRIRLTLPHPHRNETRRNKNGQTRKTHDKNRNIFRSLHSAGSDCPGVSVLRANLFRLLDVDVAQRHLPQ